VGWRGHSAYTDAGLNPESETQNLNISTIQHKQENLNPIEPDPDPLNPKPWILKGTAVPIPQHQLESAILKSKS
jgi:hypothetical protein